MTITEIRDTLTRLIDAGHGDRKLHDAENPWCWVESIGFYTALGEIAIDWESDYGQRNKD